VKIGLVQLNPVIGDFKNNCLKISKWAERAKDEGCDLVIFPELAISGYPPQDLLERNSFLQDHDNSLGNLISSLPRLDVMLGCFERSDGKNGKKLYNSAIVVRDGEIFFRARKRLLPSYDVFDETRYFRPGPVPEFYKFNDLVFGVTVCEDVWFHDIPHYETDPVEDLFQKAVEENINIDALINISASPFQRGKEQLRKDIFAKICQHHRVPFIYCNQVGGQDSLIFDGRSLVMDENGEITAGAHLFKEDFISVDSGNWSGVIHGDTKVSPWAEVYEALVTGLGDYVRKSGFSSVILGLSGGIDSALTAAIAVDALGAANVFGVALPSRYSSNDSLEDAGMLAKNLGCRFEVISIEPLYVAFQQSLSSLFAGLEEDLTEQNLQARIRGNLLMALSNKLGCLLLATGNKSEMAVGYCTLYGDMSGGLAVISDVPKQLVYELARYVNRVTEKIPMRTINKPPTAELKADQKDEDDLPPYDLLDQILELHLEKGLGRAEIVNLGFEETVVEDILKRIRRNEYKRKQAPMGLKVTSKAFGYGRRYPNVQRYRS